MANKKNDFIQYTFSLIKQGPTRFYSLTMPSDVLAECCFVSSRFDDPTEGFQRMLDKRRAEDIARYVDEYHGTVPTSIILSARPEAELEEVNKGRTLRFRKHPKAFLILDGQHRVY